MCRHDYVKYPKTAVTNITQRFDGNLSGLYLRSG